jgi:hypothetical protein
MMSVSLFGEHCTAGTIQAGNGIMIASKGKPVIAPSYPWVNDKTEDEIRRFLGDSGQSTRRKNGSAMSGLKQFSLSVINGALRSFGLEIRRT